VALRDDPAGVYADVERAIRNGLADIRGEARSGEEPLPAAQGGAGD
jgi:hypothetical protein